MINRRICMICLMIFALILSGCESGANSYTEPSLQDGQYIIYRVMSGDNELGKGIYETTTTDSYDLTQELFSAMKTQGEGGVKAALPGEVNLISFYIEDGTLVLNFTNDYLSLPATQEVLSRAAIVYTMLQIPEVSGVSFYVLDQVLLSSSGRAYGVMNEDSFEFSVDQQLKSTQVTLYFADATGTHLVGENRLIVYEAGGTLENAIISELIRGPQTQGLRPVVSSALELSQVYVSDSVCYIYFDKNFLNNTYDLADYIPIYAFVNTLTEEGYISRVQFIIDGKTDAVFRNQISLKSPISANLDYILEE